MAAVLSQINLFCKDIHFIQSTLIYSFGLTRINHWVHGAEFTGPFPPGGRLGKGV
jgi:hypothetical protein